MFSLFKKDPVKKLQEQYESLMKKAMEAQRSGDIDGYSKLSPQAEACAQEIDQLKKDS